MVDVVSGVLSGLGSLIGANASTTASSIGQQLVQNVALGAASQAIITSLGHSDVQKILDPMGILPHPLSSGPAAPAAKPTITAAAFATMPPAVQQSLLAQGVAIV